MSNPCVNSRVWPLVINPNKLEKLQHVDDPRQVPSCAHETAWFTPLAQTAFASDGATIAALPILEPHSSESYGENRLEFTPTWLEFAHKPPPRFCIVEINEPAVILPNGLVVTSSRRYDLGMDWDRYNSSSAECSQAHIADKGVYSFRFRYSYNAKRAAAKMLPLLAVAETRIRAENASILSSGSILFNFVASRATASTFIVARNQHVLATRVRLVVRHPEDAHVLNYWQRPTEINGAFHSGICAELAHGLNGPHGRPPSRRPKLLYLPRTTSSSTSRSAPMITSTGRHFDNEDVLIALTKQLAHQLNFEFSIFTFRTLRDQRRAFAEADIIAGPQGTASSGLVFAKQHVIMVEFILQRYDTVELMNAWLPRAAYIALHPHWYYGANARRPETCGGTCTGWHLTSHDLQTWERIIRCLLSSAQCRARALAVSSTSISWPGNARTTAFPSWPNTSRVMRTCTLLRYALPAKWTNIMHLQVYDEKRTREFRAAYRKQYTEDVRVCGEHNALRQPTA